MSLYYDRNGKPMTQREWFAKWEDMAYRRIAHTVLPLAAPGEPTIEVSTVWLGLDHSFTGGPPKIFETMIFGGWCHEDCEQYSTEAEALAGHERMVEHAKASTIKPGGVHYNPREPS